MAKFFFRKDRSGLPVPGSNLKATKKPSTSHTQVSTIVPAPVPNSFKPTFAGSKRYFVQMDANGDLINGTLIASTTPPEDQSFLEVFKNNVVGLRLEANQNSGAIEPTAEELAGIPVYMSEDFIQNGFRTTGKE